MAARVEGLSSAVRGFLGLGLQGFRGLGGLRVQGSYLAGFIG